VGDVIKTFESFAMGRTGGGSGLIYFMYGLIYLEEGKGSLSEEEDITRALGGDDLVR